MSDSLIAETLFVFSRRVAEEFPELRVVLDKATAKEIDEVEAMRQLAEVAAKNPAIGRRIEELARETMAPLRQAGASPEHPVIFQPGVGQPRLNPLYEAALIERAQFDGDIPELRTGQLPPGVTPAIGVSTTARNPIAVGYQLDRAARRVQDDIENKETENRKLLQAVAEGDTLALVAKAGGELAVPVEDAVDRLLGGQDPILDVVSYPRGRVPAPLSVDVPSGSALVAMSPQEQREHAWRFLSTTQGRRSAISSLTLEILRLLTNAGFEVTAREAQAGVIEPVLAHHEWTVSIDGPGATQAAFSVIDMAAKVIGKSLLDQMGERRGRVVLEVIAVNTVNVRKVGWAGRLLGVDAVLPGGAA